jgi:hypothetical protein
MLNRVGGVQDASDLAQWAQDRAVVEKKLAACRSRAEGPEP